MEYEKWLRNKRPNWKWIKDEIQKSRALLVAFEIGMAATSHPAIPIYVFRENNIDFAVPYLNYYFDRPMSIYAKEMSHLLSSLQYSIG
jgi:hypothetical protein